MIEDNKYLNELIIFSNLLNNPRYFNRVWNHLKRGYFKEGTPFRRLYDIVHRYKNKFNDIPTENALKLEIVNSLDSERYHAELMALVKLLPEYHNDNDNVDYLVSLTENFARTQAWERGILLGYEALENSKLPEEVRPKNAVTIEQAQEIMSEATRIRFDSDLGLNYREDVERAIEYNKNPNVKIPFMMNSLNIHTGDGIPRKTLNGFLASTNVGKSMALVELATQYAKLGYNVAIFTMEMEEDIYRRRLDANLLDIPLTHLEGLRFDSDEYQRKISRLFDENEKFGEIWIKEYETGGANRNTFEGYLNEIELERGFVPDVIMVDYLGIIRAVNHTDKEYQNLINASIDLRAMAQRYNAILWTATQGNKNTVNNINVDLDDGSGSFGMFSNFDFVVSISENEDYIESSQQLLKIIKSRYGQKDIKINISVSKINQQWHDVDEYLSSPKYERNVRPEISENQLNLLKSRLEENSTKQKEKKIEDKMVRNMPDINKYNDVDVNDVFAGFENSTPEKNFSVTGRVVANVDDFAGIL